MNKTERNTELCQKKSISLCQTCMKFAVARSTSKMMDSIDITIFAKDK